MKTLKLGRQARSYDPRVPHLSMKARFIPPPPPSIDWTQNMPADVGMMLNDQLGCCTAAAYYHARQVWDFNAAPPMDTEPDTEVLALYEATGGYVPSDPSTDQGANEQTVLRYLLNVGAPTREGPDKIKAYMEVDHRNHTDVKHVIAQCGIVYIGFEVPSWLMDVAQDNSTPWDVRGRKGDIEGGHAVIAAGYDEEGLTIISWGERYKMTWAFWDMYVDEAYAIVDEVFVKGTGYTPAGQTLAQLESMMQALLV